MGEAWRHLRQTFRILGRSPGFLAASVLTLAVGVGLGATVFGLVDSLAFQPLPVRAPAELIAVYGTTLETRTSHGPVSTAEFERIRDEIGAFAGVVATAYAPVAVEHSGGSRLVLGERVTPEYFSLLGVRLPLGRSFTAEEAYAPVVVLSHTAWQRHYAGDRAIVGRAIRVGGESATVLGVAPRAFTGLLHGVSPELWRPMRPEAAGSGLASSAPAADRGWLWVTGRLADGRSTEDAAAELDGLSARLRREAPAAYRDAALTAVGRRDVRVLPGLDGTLVTASWLALVGVGLVLLIASANVANLQLARTAGRRREMATRLSLGAGPAAIVRQLLVESLVLAAIGGAAGWLLALASNAALGAIRWPIPVDIVWGRALDPRVLLFTLAVSTASAVAFGLAPAIEAARSDLAHGLRTTVGGRSGKRWRRGLVIAQIALSLVLMIGAGLAARSLANVGRIDLGFDAEGVVVASFAPRLTTPRIEEFYDRLLPRVRALPGVESAGLTSHLPLTIEHRFERVGVPGAGALEKPWPRIDAATVGPQALETLRVPLLAGRFFDDGDTAEGDFVAVVNEAFAERFWPEHTALDRELRVGGIDRAYRVVGVVGTGKARTLGEAPRPVLYLTFDQDRWRREGHGGEITTGTETLVARVEGEPAETLAAIRRIAAEIEPEVAVSRLGSLQEAIGPAMAPTRAAAALFGIFGLVALVLASIGLYALMADATRRRRREIGIRMALGARPGEILRLVLRDGLGMTAAGILLGLAGAALGSRVLPSFLYGLAATDGFTWAGASLVLVGVALIACWLPARRALRADPQQTLRAE